MRFLKVVLVLCLVAMVATEAQAQKDLKGADEKQIQTNTLRVGNETGMGSGTVIHKQGDTVYLLTCKHVIAGKQKVFVVHGRKLNLAEVVGVSKSDDLALVKVELKDKNLVAIPIAADDVKEGSAVFHFGLATGPVDGKITGETLFANEQGKVWNTDAMCVAGDSGGGFYHNGELVGVLNGRIRVKRDEPEAGETFFTALPKVKAFLKESLPK